MDRKVVEAVFFGVAAMVAVVTWSVTSPTTAGCSVVPFGQMDRLSGFPEPEASSCMPSQTALNSDLLRMCGFGAPKNFHLFSGDPLTVPAPPEDLGCGSFANFHRP